MSVEKTQENVLDNYSELELLRTFARSIFSSWFYGDMKLETASERVQAIILKKLGYIPDEDVEDIEDWLITKADHEKYCEIVEQLYKFEAPKIPNFSDFLKRKLG